MFGGVAVVLAEMFFPHTLSMLKPYKPWNLGA